MTALKVIGSLAVTAVCLIAFFAMTEEYERPAIVIGLDGELGRGSARTVADFDVLEAISGAAEHLLRFGGHTQAAGLEVPPSEIEAVRERICERCDRATRHQAVRIKHQHGFKRCTPAGDPVHDVADLFV